MHFMSHSTGILPERRILKLVGLFGAEISVLVDAAGEQVLHQAGLDALLLGDEAPQSARSPGQRSRARVQSSIVHGCQWGTRQ